MWEMMSECRCTLQRVRKREFPDGWFKCRTSRNVGGSGEMGSRIFLGMAMEKVRDELDVEYQQFGAYLVNYMRTIGNLYIAYM